MSRGQGRVYRPTVNGTVVQVWWLDYSHRGQRHRESSGTTNKTEALKLLRARAAARDAGKLVGNPDHVTLAQLRALTEQSYTIKNRRSLRRLTQAWAHLEEHFGRAARVPDLSMTAIMAYEAKRRAEGAAQSTAHYEKAALRLGFRLALKAGLLATMPVIETPKIKSNIREASFTQGELAALLLELSPLLQPLVRFLFYTAWRESEGRLLTWDRVDWEAGVIRLGRAKSKSGEPREYPFAAVADLKQVIDAQYRARDGMYVFHDHGKPIGYGKLRSGWKSACLRSGLAAKDAKTKIVTLHRRVHDLRRAGADWMRQHDISESDVMEMAGWETPEMFRRYRIKNRQALASAAAKLNSGKGPAQSEASPASQESLT